VDAAISCCRSQWCIIWGITYLTPVRELSICGGDRVSEWATQEGKCVICGKPVDYEDDVYCRRCGMRSELDDMRSKGPSSLVAERVKFPQSSRKPSLEDLDHG
jgi:hypothetical protein